MAGAHHGGRARWGREHGAAPDLVGAHCVSRARWRRGSQDLVRRAHLDRISLELATAPARRSTDSALPPIARRQGRPTAKKANPPRPHLVPHLGTSAEAEPQGHVYYEPSKLQVLTSIAISSGRES